MTLAQLTRILGEPSDVDLDRSGEPGRAQWGAGAVEVHFGVGGHDGACWITTRSPFTGIVEGLRIGAARHDVSRAFPEGSGVGSLNAPNHPDFRNISLHGRELTVDFDATGRVEYLSVIYSDLRVESVRVR